MQERTSARKNVIRFCLPKRRTSISRSSIHMQIVVSETPVSMLDRFYACCFKPRAHVRCNFDHHVLEETTLRTDMYFFFKFQFACTEYFSGIACKKINRYLFLVCCCKPTFYVFLSDSLSLGKPTLRTVFLVALFCCHTCRKHDICLYICHVSTVVPCVNTDLLQCLFFDPLCLDGTWDLLLLRSIHLV